MWFGGVADHGMQSNIARLLLVSVPSSSSFEVGHLPPPITVGVLEALGDGVPVGREEKTGSSIFQACMILVISSISTHVFARRVNGKQKISQGT